MTVFVPIKDVGEGASAIVTLILDTPLPYASVACTAIVKEELTAMVAGGSVVNVSLDAGAGVMTNWLGGVLTVPDVAVKL